MDNINRMSLLSHYLQLGQATEWYGGGESLREDFVASLAVFQGSLRAWLVNIGGGDKCTSS